MIHYEYDGVKTTARLTGTKYDARNQIKNVTGLVFLGNEYLIDDEYEASVSCYVGDEYDPEVGKEKAREKLLKKYYGDIDKITKRFMYELERVNHRALKKFCR